MSYDDLKFLKQKIESTTQEEKIEIFNIFKKNNVNYTQNKNGIFIILNNIEKSTINKIYNFLNFLDDSKKITKEMEEKMNKLNKLKN